MRYTSLPVAALTLALLSAGCDTPTVPQDGSMLAESEALFARNNVNTPAGVTLGNLIAALNNVNVNIQDFQALNDLTIGDINIVNVENVLNNARVLENARFLNNVTILQDFLNNSLNDLNVQILNNALNNLDLAITDVVAIDVLSGEVIVFHQ